jgi:hypothetical protein
VWGCEVGELMNGGWQGIEGWDEGWDGIDFLL